MRRRWQIVLPALLQAEQAGQQRTVQPRLYSVGESLAGTSCASSKRQQGHIRGGRQFAHRRVLESEGTAAVAKGRIRRDTPPGMCTCQTRQQGLHQHMTEIM